MDPDELTHHIDALLCITSNSADHASALMALEVGLAGFVVGSENEEGEEEESVRQRVRNRPKTPTPTTRLDAFLRLQDRFEYNITTVLLHWLGSSIVIMTQPRIDQLGPSCEQNMHVGALAEPDGCRCTDADLLRSNLIRCLALLQGLLLMHRPSRALFVRRSALQSLLAVLDLSRPSHVSSPLLSHPPASPSPIHFPSPSTSHHPTIPRTPHNPPSSLSTSPPNRTTPHSNGPNPTNDPSQLSLAALEALLCALVDRPENMRTFEQVGGLATIVRLLKDKTVGQSVRIKVIELLYYFLLPEQEPHTLNFSRPSSSTSTSEFDPNSRSHTPPPITSTPPTKSPSKQTFVLPREERLAHASRGFVPQTPVKVRRFRNGNGSGSDEDGGDSSPLDAEDGEDDRTPRRPNGKTNGNGRTIRSGKEVVSVGKRVTRTTKEKKEMLRKVMPNVDALEERFRAMGLGLGLG
ncbi:BQ5605_C030g10825 [Microbotryum silenes-dioicae]|uniref:BQ5605_C030g10825 protein n=1 Tax=Microbotryum silenes-dioicae TaxID=796604 RepID=A0A2X0PIB7_9BASI|nr:BQ5605_C030g10825 [Microbotryum silenes-dioicae]